MTFDLTVNLGNLIQFIGVAVMLVSIYVKFSNRLVILEVEFTNAIRQISELNSELKRINMLLLQGKFYPKED